MLKSLIFKLFVLLTLVSLTIGACASPEIVLPPDDANTIANGGKPVFVAPAACTGVDPIETEWGPMSLCQDFSGDVDVIDAAMLASLSTPIPDEYVVGVVWAAKKGEEITKLVVKAGVAILAGQVAGQTYVEVSQSSGTITVINEPEPEYLAEVSASLSASLGNQVWLAISDDNQSANIAASSLTSGNCVPDPLNGEKCHIVTDGDIAKIQSRIHAMKQTTGKSYVQCLIREGVNEAVMLVFEVTFKGVTSGKTYKGVNFIHNVKAPERSTFASLRRLKDAQMPDFVENPGATDPRCQAAKTFMDNVSNFLTSMGY